MALGSPSGPTRCCAAGASAPRDAGEHGHEGSLVRVLVTGASGVLGSSVARALVSNNHDVTTLQRRPSGVDGARDVLGSSTEPDTVATA
ncbi:MAG: NAD-dependent epimerase/dehydratase family protein, partial [Microbacterium gubbeenense]